LVIANFLLSATDNHSIIQIVNFGKTFFFFFNILYFFSLGAGTDTLYFWMADIWQNYSFHLYEIDFPDALSKKLSILIRYYNIYNRLFKFTYHIHYFLFRRQPLRERLQTASMRLPSDEMLSSSK
jgi:hypothetical protein